MIPSALTIQRSNKSRSNRAILIAQFDVPVRQIDEVLPEVVLRGRKCDMHERPPLRSLGFANQAHVRFARKPVAFARIATDTRANDVLPRGCPSPITRYDVIQIEFAAIENLAAVLAGVLVALKHIVSGKFHFLLRKPIENQKHNHPRDTNLERNRRDDFVVRRVCRQIAPAFEIVRHKIVRLVGRNNVGMTGIDQREGATRRADVNRLPQAVKHQNLIV